MHVSENKFRPKAMHCQPSLQMVRSLHKCKAMWNRSWLKPSTVNHQCNWLEQYTYAWQMNPPMSSHNRFTHQLVKDAWPNKEWHKCMAIRTSSNHAEWTIHAVGQSIKWSKMVLANIMAQAKHIKLSMKLQRAQDICMAVRTNSGLKPYTVNHPCRW